MTTPTPRFEPRQLRDWAGNRECCEGVSAETVAYERLAHAAVLEELAAAKEARQAAEVRVRMTAQAERIQIERAQRAEAELASVKAHAEAMAVHLNDGIQVDVDQEDGTQSPRSEWDFVANELVAAYRAAHPKDAP